MPIDSGYPATPTLDKMLKVQEGSHKKGAEGQDGAHGRGHFWDGVDAAKEEVCLKSKTQ